MAKSRKYEIGDIINGEFKVLDVFGGEGISGMGEVYLVQNREIDSPVILKTYQAKNQENEKRFLEEAKIWISICGHRNIVKVEFAEKFFGEQIFICAEYIEKDEEGRNSISDYLKQGEQSIYLMIKWVAQFCYAMNYALKKGLKVHRDIKPDNLMVDNGDLKITDFGISKQLLENDKDKNLDIKKCNISNLTNDNSFIGTLLYASPEQIIDSKNIDCRSDIYSFGVVLYQLISGNKYPFDIENALTSNFINAKFDKQIIPVDHALFPIADKCLQKNPNKRYQDYDSLLNDLKNIANNIKISIPDDESDIDDVLGELYSQSCAYGALGDYDNALEAINKYLNLYKGHYSAWTQKGRILMEMGMYKEAIEATLKSLEINPYNSHALNNLGLLHKRTFEYSKSIYYLQKAIKVDKYNAGAHMNLATAYEMVDDMDKAFYYLMKALEINPNKKNLQHNTINMVEYAIKNLKIDTAIQLLEKLVQVETDNDANNWFNLGLCYSNKGYYIKAIDCYLKVISILPNDEKALRFLSNSYTEIGDLSNALKYCERALDIADDKTFAVCIKAQILYFKEGFMSAMNFLKNYFIANPNNDNLWLVLSDIYGREGKIKEAINAALKAKNILLSLNTEFKDDNLKIIEERLKYYNGII